MKLHKVFTQFLHVFQKGLRILISAVESFQNFSSAFPIPKPVTACISICVCMNGIWGM